VVLFGLMTRELPRIAVENERYPARFS